MNLIKYLRSRHELLPKVQIVAFIPLYNEEDNVSLIGKNVATLSALFPDILVYVSDNHSTDRTLPGLVDLQKAHPGHIIIHRNQENIGFSRNMANVSIVNGDPLIMLLGANDIVSYEGGLHLRKFILANRHIDFIMCNWAYYKDLDGGEKEIIWSGDVYHPFQAGTLDEFFAHHQSAPNGIMQWVARKHILEKMNLHTTLNSPHLGAFFDAFPTRMAAIGNPALCLVKHLEDSGWRSTPEKIIRSHISLATEIALHLKRCRDENRMSQKTYLEWSYVVYRIPRDIFKATKKGNWGRWSGHSVRLWLNIVALVARLKLMPADREFFGMVWKRRVSRYSSKIAKRSRMLIKRR